MVATLVAFRIAFLKHGVAELPAHFHLRNGSNHGAHAARLAGAVHGVDEYELLAAPRPETHAGRVDREISRHELCRKRG